MATTSTAIELLPFEVWLRIGEYLSIQELATLASVCKWFAMLSHHHYIWKSLFQRHPLHHWWTPYKPSDPFLRYLRTKSSTNSPGKFDTSLPWCRYSQFLRSSDSSASLDYRKEYKSKSRASQRLIRWNSFKNIAPAGCDMDSKQESYERAGNVVRWERTESANGKFGANRITLRGLIVGDHQIGKNSLALALQRLYPAFCISLDHYDPQSLALVPLSRDSLSDQEKKMSAYQYFGNVPIRFQIEIGDIIYGKSFGKLVRREIYEDVRPNVILLLWPVAVGVLEKSKQERKTQMQLAARIIRSYYNDLPILLVGTKVDLRDKSNEKGGYSSYTFSEYSEGIELAYALRAVNYVECSVKSGLGLVDVLTNGVALAVRESLEWFTNEDGRNEEREEEMEFSSEEQSEGEQKERISRVHTTAQCGECRCCPVVGVCYRCSECWEAGYGEHYLCGNCFEERERKGVSDEHRFRVLKHKKLKEDEWKKRKRRSIEKTQMEGDGTTLGTGFSHPESVERRKTSERAVKRQKIENGANAEQESHGGLDEGNGEKKRAEEVCQREGIGKDWIPQVQEIWDMFSKSK